MSHKSHVRSFAIAVAVLVVGGVCVRAEDNIGAARTLYTDAAYEDALAMLEKLAPVSPAETAEVGRYRALCLLALGRAPEAQAALVAMVEADPTATLEPRQVSPTVRALFDTVRQRTVPTLLRKRFADARAAFVEKRYPEATRGFTDVIALLADPAVQQLADEGADMRMLAEGYLDLAKAADSTSRPVPVSPSALAVTLPKALAPPPPHIVAPVAISQRMPRPPSQLIVTPNTKVVLEVVIDERGRVERATIVQSLNPAFDMLLLAATKDWRYQPATRDGQPVKFVKVLEITLQAR